MIKEEYRIAIEDCIEKLIEWGYGSRDDVDGYTEEEVVEIETSLGITLPGAFRAFLLLMGHRMGKFKDGESMLFPRESFPISSEVYHGMHQNFDEILAENNLPPVAANAFVFYDLGSYLFNFFYLDGGDNPPVYVFSEGTTEQIQLGWDSFIANIQDHVNYHCAMVKLKRAEDYIHQINDELLRLGLAKPDEISGYYSQRFNSIEDWIGYYLPSVFSSFLFRIGDNAGEFMRGERMILHLEPDQQAVDWYRALRDDANVLLAADGLPPLPGNALVFHMRPGGEFFYLLLIEYNGFDPIVWRFAPGMSAPVSSEVTYSEYMRQRLDEAYQQHKAANPGLAVNDQAGGPSANRPSGGTV